MLFATYAVQAAELAERLGSHAVTQFNESKLKPRLNLLQPAGAHF